MKKNLSLALLPELVPTNRLDGQTVGVVIDNLRFTTTASIALNHGASAVVTAREVATTRDLAAQAPPNSVLLCGERDCHLIPGFDLGNSPADYPASTVAGKQLLFTTTNGTRAIEAGSGCGQLLLGALVNRAAVAEQLAALPFTSCWLICAGTDGQVATEDVLTAGAILEYWLELAGDELQLHNDAAWMALQLWKSLSQERPTPTQLVSAFELASGGRNLVETGYAEDLVTAAQLDTIRCVPASQSPDLRHFVPLCAPASAAASADS